MCGPHWYYSGKLGLMVRQLISVTTVVDPLIMHSFIGLIEAMRHE